MKELWEGLWALRAVNEDNNSDESVNIIACVKNPYVEKGLALCRKREDWSICIMTHGRLALTNTSEAIEKNQLRIFPPMSEQCLRYETLSTSYWIHLQGNEVDEIMKQLDIPFNKTYEIANNNATAILDEIIMEYLMKQRHYKETSILLVKKFLYNIPREIDTKRSTTVDLLKNAVSQLYLNPTLSNEECAALCFITPTTFIRMFKSYYGVTPHKFKQQLIIARAKTLLQQSDLSITDIALELGFNNNTLYFSNYFKKHTGIYPSDYRKQFAIDTPSEYDSSSI